MKWLKKILAVLLVAFIVIQFFRPEKNIQAAPSAHDLITYLPVPDDVQQILVNACYDCHSNNTRYPWYAHVQPVGWWLADHIDEGKYELNYSEFAAYSLRKQYHKLEETIDVVKSGEMPLDDYTFLHSEARLSQQQKEALVNWAAAMMDTLKSRHPIDSLMAPTR